MSGLAKKLDQAITFQAMGTIVRVEGQLPAQTRPGFGVLVVASSGTASGVMLYTGPPVARAPVVGPDRLQAQRTLKAEPAAAVRSGLILVLHRAARVPRRMKRSLVRARKGVGREPSLRRR